MWEQRPSPAWLTWGDMEHSFALSSVWPVALRRQTRTGSPDGSDGLAPFPQALESSSISPAPTGLSTALLTLPPSQNSPHPLQPPWPPPHTSSPQHCPSLHSLSLSSSPRPVLPCLPLSPSQFLILLGSCSASPVLLHFPVSSLHPLLLHRLQPHLPLW